MNYFIFYKNTCVAYTDNKKMMKAFINTFENKEDFVVDKFKDIDQSILDEQVIEDMTLYYHHEAQMFLNDGLDQEIYAFIDGLNEKIMNNIDRLDKTCYYLKVDDNEDYILSQFLLNYGVLIEDTSWQLFNNIDARDILENHVFPLMNEQFNRKE